MIKNIDLVAVGVASAVFLVIYGFRKKRSLPLPPGPKGLPLIGNIFDFPKSHEWEMYAKWSKEFGLLDLCRFFTLLIFSRF
jgi:hypothetical protein